MTMNDGHEQDCKDAEDGRIGADRMALGLSCIPDPKRGDMAEVANLRAALEMGLEDKARLDAMQSLQWTVGWNEYGATFTVQARGQVVGTIGKGHALRGAIDRARFRPSATP